MLKQQKGFTLIELMVVVTIIGIISAFAVNTYQNQQEKVMRSVAKSAISSVSQQLQMYYIKTQRKVLTLKDYQDFKKYQVNGVVFFQSPENDPNFAKHFTINFGVKKDSATDKNVIHEISAVPKSTNKFKVGAYYNLRNGELKACKASIQADNQIAWTDCK